MLCMDPDGVPLEDGLMDIDPGIIGVARIGVDLALVLGVPIVIAGKASTKIKASSIETC